MNGELDLQGERNPDAFVNAQPASTAALIPPDFHTRMRFGRQLRQLREQARLSLRDLAQRAHLPHSVISAIEAGEKTTGPRLAEKLADALNLFSAAPRLEFLVQAAGTRKRDKLIESSQHVAPEIINYLPWRLRAEGLDPAGLRSPRWSGPDLVVDLDDGRRVRCQVRLRFDAQGALEK